MEEPKRHEQVAAKVTTYVDKEIKELIEVLNTFDNVSTFESCQGGNGRLAFVYMEYGLANDFAEVAEFAHKMASILATITKEGSGISPDPAYDIDIAIEWGGDKKSPFISLKFPSDSVKDVTNIFAHIRGLLDMRSESKLGGSAEYSTNRAGGILANLGTRILF